MCVQGESGSGRLQESLSPSSLERVAEERRVQLCSEAAGLHVSMAP